MKEYSIKINLIVETEESDYERVTLYAQELADNLLQDENIFFDDIIILETNVEEVQSLSDDYVDIIDDDEGDDNDEY